MATETDTLLLQIKADNAQILAKLTQAEKATKTVAKKMESALKSVGIAFSAAFAIQGIKNIALAADEMARLQARLLATTGGAKQAAEAMNFLQKSAEEQSVDLLDLSNAYTRLLPAVKSNVITMEEMRTILTLANDNIKALGLGSAEAQGLFLGLSQALGSGTVTMEDLRQVTDRLPGSLSKMAEANGLAVNEFKKLIATGEITADMIKGPLIEAFRENEGGAEAMANTLDSATTRMGNAFRNLAATIGESGLNDAMVGLADTATNSANAFTGFLENMQFAGRVMANEYSPAFQTAAEEQQFFNDQVNASVKAIQDEGKAIAETARLKAEAAAIEAENAPLTEKEREKLEKELQDFRDSLRSKEEALADSNEVNLELLRESLENELITKEEFKQLELEQEMAFEEAKNKIREEGEQRRLDIVNNSQGKLFSNMNSFLDDIKKAEEVNGLARVGVLTNTFSSMLGEAAKHNRALFELNKVSGIANAVISTAQGIAKALEMPFPISLVAGAAVAAAGAAQIATISSQTFGGGGGGVSSPSASAASAPISEETAAGGEGGEGANRGLDISIAGLTPEQMFSGAQVQGLIAAINDQVDDGAIIKSIGA